MELALLLQSKQSTIPYHIQELTFELGKKQLPLLTIPGDGSRSVIDKIAIVLKNCIPSLRKLSLSYDGRYGALPHLEYTKLAASRHGTIDPSFSRVTQLELYLSREENPIPLIRFICSFPSLEVLKMHSGCEGQIDGEILVMPADVQNLILPTSLKTLQLGGSENVASEGLHLFYQWLGSTGIPASLSTLSIYRVNIGGFSQPLTTLDPEIEPYLHRCSTLSFLHLGFDTGYIAPLSTAFFDLSAPQNLTHLAISIRNIVQDDPDLMLLELIRKMLTTLTSPLLHQITFNVFGSGFRVLPDQWDALDTLLATPKFTAVQVELVVPFSDSTIDDGTSEEDLTKARECFSKCDSQERLTVIRAPFVMKTRTWRETPEEAKQFEDYDVIDWVCRRLSLW
ncbi:hypothetical protein AAF712_015023 [Marasmius tenuissimus]|uniref:Uncharacterized protein n=1 Tax=Marasmius tenuissimus TaxID=585030 RepID=A0ABR2ZBM9_9AGAR